MKHLGIEFRNKLN